MLGADRVWARENCEDSSPLRGGKLSIEGAGRAWDGVSLRLVGPLGRACCTRLIHRLTRFYLHSYASG